MFEQRSLEVIALPERRGNVKAREEHNGGEYNLRGPSTSTFPPLCSFAPYLITPSSRACLHKRMQERPISKLDEYWIAGVFTRLNSKLFPTSLSSRDDGKDGIVFRESTRNWNVSRIGTSTPAFSPTDSRKKE